MTGTFNTNTIKVVIDKATGQISPAVAVTLRNEPTLNSVQQGASTIESLANVVTNNESTGVTLVYNATTQQWVAQELNYSDIAGTINLDGGTF